MGPGAVAVICDRLARFTSFNQCLVGLITHLPSGSSVYWSQGSSVPENHARAAEHMLADENLEWLFVLGDDHVFEPELLPRLLSHNVDAVVPVVLRRSKPYLPVLYDKKKQDGIYTYLDLPRVAADERGLIKVRAAGSAGLLVRRHVLEKMPKPVFPPDKPLDDPTRNRVGTDLLFCDALYDAGFDLYVDTKVSMGHLLVSCVSPAFSEERGWSVTVGMNVDDFFIGLPWGAGGK